VRMKKLPFCIGVLLALALALGSCGKLSTPEPVVLDDKKAEPDDAKVERFQIDENEISYVTVYQGPVNYTVSGVIESATDIQLLADILNGATYPVGNGTADYYRLFKIMMKDGSEENLEFGGHGRFFKIVETGVFFKLEPEKHHEVLHELVDRIEKEYQAADDKID